MKLRKYDIDETFNNFKDSAMAVEFLYLVIERCSPDYFVDRIIEMAFDIAHIEMWADSEEDCQNEINRLYTLF